MLWPPLRRHAACGALPLDSYRRLTDLCRHEQSGSQHGRSDRGGRHGRPHPGPCPRRGGRHLRGDRPGGSGERPGRSLRRARQRDRRRYQADAGGAGPLVRHGGGRRADPRHPRVRRAHRAVGLSALSALRPQRGRRFAAGLHRREPDDSPRALRGASGGGPDAAGAAQPGWAGGARAARCVRQAR